MQGSNDTTEILPTIVTMKYEYENRGIHASVHVNKFKTKL